MNDLGSKAPHLPIWRDAQRLLVWAETAVRHFPRYHKYTLGTQLRGQVLLVCRQVLRAQAADAGDRYGIVAELHLAAEELKVLLQLGNRWECHGDDARAMAVRHFPRWQALFARDGIAAVGAEQAGRVKRHRQGLRQRALSYLSPAAVLGGDGTPPGSVWSALIQRGDSMR